MQDIIVMNQVSAKDLTTLSKERERKQREIFVVILERVYSRIKRDNTTSTSSWEPPHSRPIPHSALHDDTKAMKLSIKRRPIEMQQPFRCIGSFVPHNIFPPR
eukprot:gene17312-23621_t